MNKVNKLFYEIYWFFKNLFRRRKPNKVGSKSEMDLNDYDDNEHAYVVSPLFVHCSDNDIDKQISWGWSNSVCWSYCWSYCC